MSLTKALYSSILIQRGHSPFRVTSGASADTHSGLQSPASARMSASGTTSAFLTPVLARLILVSLL
jgi:hypothetical protein